MIKKILAAAVCFLSVLGFTGCSMMKRDLIETSYDLDAPPKMMFLGDSIAAGYGLDGYALNDNYNCPDSYANILKKQYETELAETSGHEMQNFAVSGDTSSDLLEFLNSGKLDSALSETDAVVVSIGGNDLLGIVFEMIGSLGITVENGSIDFSDVDIFKAAAALSTMEEDVDKALTGFEANLKEISSVLNSKTNGIIYIQTLYDPLETFTDFSMVTEFSEEKINKFNEIIKTNAPSSYTVIDVAADFNGKCAELTRIADLDIHPNEKGHKVIAEAVDEAFANTGFTYTKQEYGEPHLTLTAILLIIGGLCAMLLVVIVIIPKLFKKYEE